MIQAEIQALQELQRQREVRGAVMAGMTIPEYHSGGLVPGAGGWGLQHDEVLAILQRGERVIDRDTVRAWGNSFFDAVQAAPRFHAGGNVGWERGSEARHITQNFYLTQAPGRAKSCL